MYMTGTITTVVVAVVGLSAAVASGYYIHLMMERDRQARQKHRFLKAYKNMKRKLLELTNSIKQTNKSFTEIEEKILRVIQGIESKALPPPKEHNSYVNENASRADGIIQSNYDSEGEADADSELQKSIKLDSREGIQVVDQVNKTPVAATDLDTKIEKSIELNDSLDKLRLSLLFVQERLYKLMESVDSIVPENVFIHLTMRMGGGEEDLKDEDVLEQKQILTEKIRKSRKKVIMLATTVDNKIIALLEKLNSFL